MTEGRGWNSLDKLIVEKLCEEPEISAFFLYENLGFSPISISESVGKLTEEGLVYGSSGSINRTEHFFDLVLKMRHQIYNRNMPWKRVLD